MVLVHSSIKSSKYKLQYKSTSNIWVTIKSYDHSELDKLKGRLEHFITTHVKYTYRVVKE